MVFALVNALPLVIKEWMLDVEFIFYFFKKATLKLINQAEVESEHLLKHCNMEVLLHYISKGNLGILQCYVYLTAASYLQIKISHFKKLYKFLKYD